ncbi:phosphoglycerate dehydrogenase [Camillea tinctor]|nr:phosphoglycerate dehydrogenase [Camillea tinctor]
MASGVVSAGVQTTRTSTPLSRPRILVPEKVSPDGLALLTADFEVEFRPGLTPEQLIEEIPAYHGLIVRSETKVTAAVLAAARNLRVVARAGVGVDNIDVDAATAQGIVVVNSPSGNIVAAAEHTVALLLATARNIGRADRGSKEGRWERSSLVGVEVGRKTLGIIGLGKVGMKVARICAAGLGMRVLAVDPYASPDRARQEGVELVPALADLLPNVDFLTIHTPLLASTLDLLGKAEFRTMKPTARVLNVARGGVYNEKALLKALDEGWIAGAGLDVYTQEPPPALSQQDDDSAARLLRHPKVVATPHLGASTVEAQENVSLDACTQVRAVLRGEPPTSAVNAPLIPAEEHRRLQPYARLVERMGALYTQHYVNGPRGSSSSSKGRLGGRTFELAYRGDLASAGNTRPLLAALVRGLVGPVSDRGGRDVNMVNAAKVAEEKGFVISEVRVHGAEGSAFASQVTLRAGKAGGQVIEGYAAGENIYISKLDRFTASFTPEGTLLILHNYDEPGKIGGVGMVLGRYGINISFMQVASLDVGSRGLEGKGGEDEGLELTRMDSAVAGVGAGNTNNDSASVSGAGDNEALMILGVEGEVTREVLDGLEKAEGVLNVSLVRL